MSLQRITSLRIVAVELDDRREGVRHIFESTRFHHRLIVEDGRYWGVASDRDLLLAMNPFIGRGMETARGVATLTKRVQQIMSREPITLRPVAQNADAINWLLASSIPCIPIVDDAFQRIGIVCRRDVLKALAPP